jgi:3',5'-cyclic AMP phosphodiesterase CpdA
MLIAHISDSHICLPEPEGAHRLRDLVQVVDEVNRREVDVVVHTGDIVHQGLAEEYHAARAILDGLNAPLYVIPGNKDRRDPMREILAGAIGRLKDKAFFQYAVNDWPVRLIMLDTLNESHRLGQFCQTRLDGLAALLEEQTEKPAIIFMHHPPFDVVEAPHPFQFDSQESVEQLSKVLQRHPQVQAIFCGHSHRYAEDKVGGIPSRTIPAVAIDLRRGEYADRNRPVFEVYDVSDN